MIVAHIHFVQYLIRHKWHVFRACRELGVSPWQALVHDWTKLLPPECFPYIEFFYVHGSLKDGKNERIRTIPGFDYRIVVAKNHHQKRNPHHWQYWLHYTDHQEPRLRPLPIPERFVREMVADWIGAGRAQGKPDVLQWYHTYRHKILLHPDTRTLVEHLLHEAQQKGLIPGTIA